MTKTVEVPRYLRHWKPSSKVAVWKYDIYPYWLCGVVEEFLPKGRVAIHGYDSYQFTPIKIFWGKEGRQFLIDDQNLRNEYAAAKKEFDNEWLLRSEVLLNGG